MELNSDFVGQTREKELNLALEEINWYHWCGIPKIYGLSKVVFLLISSIQ